MKKVLFAIPILMLLAAGCNSGRQAAVSAPAPVQTQAAAASQNINPPTPAPTPAAAPTQPPAQMHKTVPGPAPVPSPKPVTPAAAQTPPPSQAKPVLMLGSSSSLGQYLESGNSMTLYYYTNDTPITSNCYGSCAANWPPYVLPAGTQLAVTQGIHGKLSLVARKDGTMQLNYNNQPLYFFVNDAKAGDTTGNQVNGFFVAKP